MFNLELQKYVSAQLAAGFSLDKIKANLAISGWSEIDIADSIPKDPSTTVVAAQSIEQDSNANMADPQVDSAQTQPVKKKSSGLVQIFAILLIVLLVVGGIAGVYAYNSYMEDPMRVFAEMGKKGDLKTYTYDMDITSSYTMPTNTSNESLSISMKSVGDVDIKDEKNIKFSSTLSFSVTSEMVKGKASGQIVWLKDMLYFKVSEIPDLGDEVRKEAEAYLNKWFSYSLKAIQEQAGTDLISPSTTVTAEQTKQVQEAFMKNQCITLSKNIPSTAVSGVETYHYKYVIVKEKIVPFLKEVTTIIKQEVTAEDIEELQDSLKYIDIEGEVWIGKKDYMPYKVTMNFKFINESDGSTLATSVLTVSMKNFDNIPEITAPADAKPLEEATTPVSSALISKRNEQRNSDVQKILNAIVAYRAEQGHAITDFGAIPLCTATPAPISAMDTGTPPMGSINLYKLVVGKYITKIPKDPIVGLTADTGYTICKTFGGKVQIAAPNAENSAIIVVNK